MWYSLSVSVWLPGERPLDFYYQPGTLDDAKAAIEHCKMEYVFRQRAIALQWVLTDSHSNLVEEGVAGYGKVTKVTSYPK